MIKLNDEGDLFTENKEIRYNPKLANEVDKIRERIIGPDIIMGAINYETPILKFFKSSLNKDIINYVYHKEVLINQNEKLILFILKDQIVLTDRLDSDTLERCETIASTTSNSSILNYSNTFFMKIDYKNIYSYDLEINDNKRNLIFKLIKSDNFSIISNLTITFKSYKDLYIVRHFIDRYKTISWQSFFESNLPIMKPLIYQNHFFLQKINKRGKQQSRVIIFTNKFIFNVPFKLICKENYSNNFDLDIIKWALAIESIKSLTVSKKKLLTTKLIIDTKLNTKLADFFKFKSKRKNEIEFLFYYEADMRKFILMCRSLFYETKRTYLTINIS